MAPSTAFSMTRSHTSAWFSTSHLHTNTHYTHTLSLRSDVENAKPGAAGAAPAGYKLPAGVISASPQAKKAAKQNGIKIESVKVGNSRVCASG